MTELSNKGDRSFQGENALDWKHFYDRLLRFTPRAGM